LLPMMRAEGRIRVLLADDHPIVRGAVARILTSTADMDIVAEADDGLQAVELYARHRPDVALVDLRLPGLEGIEVVRRILRQHPDAVTVILTAYDTHDDIDRAIRAGAKAYLLKDVSPRDLVACVRAVRAGSRWVAPAVAVHLADRTRGVRLTPREMAVLRLLATGMSNRDIGMALSICERTVKSHPHHVFHRLGVASRTEALAVAVRRGLMRLT
jgi:two-component system, NarL family, response regulator